jgi:hypothetical protein
MTLFPFLLTHLAFAQPTMTFTYEPAEGQEPSPCTYEQIKDLPDYDVTCATPFGVKNFGAHVIVREFPHASKGDTGVEILYWVTERGDAQRKFHSTSALFHLKGSTTLADFSLSQGVENDFASLALGWRNP